MFPSPESTFLPELSFPLLFQALLNALPPEEGVTLNVWPVNLCGFSVVSSCRGRDGCWPLDGAGEHAVNSVSDHQGLQFIYSWWSGSQHTNTGGEEVYRRWHQVEWREEMKICQQNKQSRRQSGEGDDQPPPLRAAAALKYLTKAEQFSWLETSAQRLQHVWGDLLHDCSIISHPFPPNSPWHVWYLWKLLNLQQTFKWSPAVFQRPCIHLSRLSRMRLFRARGLISEAKCLCALPAVWKVHDWKVGSYLKKPPAQTRSAQ